MTGSCPRPGLVPVVLPLLLVVLLAPTTGAGPPEVLQLRVPSSRTSTWFPAGTELTGLAPDQFKELLGAARAGAIRRDRDVLPRLLRAHHTARWDDGLLTGHSELVILPAEFRDRELILEPWTPALLPRQGGDPVVRVSDGGQVSLKLDEAGRGSKASTVGLDWQLRTPPGSGGFKVQLGLPDCEVSDLSLDLPSGWVPEGRTGLRETPSASGPPGRSSWTFLGQGGAYELRLARSEGQGEEPDAARLWCGGPTRVDVAESTANWTLEWSLSGGVWAPRQLAIDLDPGLDLIEVAGTAVEEYRSEPVPAPGTPDGKATRVTVRLRGHSAAGRAAAPVPGLFPLPAPMLPLGGVPAPLAAVAPASNFAPSVVIIRAMAVVAPEGRWRIPAARPVNAVWTGGSTTVKLGPSRVISGVRLLAGRRAVARASVAADERQLVFEADRPASVAEIDMQKPSADVSAEVHGQLEVGPGSPRLDCRLVWQVHRGRLHDLDFDLPRAWTADRVEVEGSDGPVTWHPDVLPDGGVRVRVPFPTGDWATRPVMLRVGATAQVAGGRGPLALPRVRPVAARLSDEVWVARTEAGISLQPRDVRGLAWIDPALVAALPEAVTAGARATAAQQPFHPALAWRWLADDAEARVDRDRTEPSTVASVETTMTVAPDRLRVQARLEITARDQPLRTLAVGLSEPLEDPDSWRFFEESSGLEVTHRSLTAQDRAAEGLSGTGPAWLLELAGPQRGKIVLTGRHESSWKGRGNLPLILLPPSFGWRGVVLVLTGRNVLTSVATRAVRTLDPDVASESITPDTTGTSATDPSRGAFGLDLRRAHAFAYDTPGAQVTVQVGALTPASGEGVIRDALLSTVITPGLPIRQQLTLRVIPELASSLTIALPPGTNLERVFRDGIAVTPTRSAEAIVVPLRAAPGGTGQARGQVCIGLDYTGPATGTTGALRVSPLRPGMSLPCLGLEWNLVLPASWRVSRWGPGLTTTDPAVDDEPQAWNWLAPLRWARRWRSRRAPGELDADAQALRALDARVVDTRAEELSLGEWFLRWDAGSWPVVVDRVALASAGWGPRSPVAPPRTQPGKAGAAQAWLEPLGLTAMPVGGVILVTTREQARAIPDDQLFREDKAAEWRAAVREAVAWGGDRSDRFQSVARWREEPVPRAAFRSDGTPADRFTQNRPSRHFIATGWPDSGAEVDLVDVRGGMAWTWVTASIVLVLGLLATALPGTLRTAFTVGLLGVGALIWQNAPPRFSGPAFGLAAGAVGVACLGLGRSLPWPRRRRWRESRTSTFRRPPARQGLATPIIAGLVVAGIATPWALAQVGAGAGAGAPIIALLPYDGPPDPSRPPGRVLLRLADYQRLRVLADEPAAPATRALRATSAVHRVSWRDHDAVAVESALALEAIGGTTEGPPLDWSFPAEDAREIGATLDGTETPVRIEDGGKRATVRVDLATGGVTGARTHALVIRRVVAAVAGQRSISAALSINRIATARVEVALHPAGLRAEIPGARGQFEGAGRPGVLKGLLGPVGRLEVRWLDPTAAPSRKPGGSVEVFSLWDCIPAGDRVRARLTYRTAGGTPVVRIGLEPGTLVRDATLPTGAEVTWEGTPDRPEWVARMVPPLPEGGTVSLDVWRPGPLRELSENTPVVRTAPRIEPLGIDRFTGTLAFRRPSDWVGRIVPAGGSEAFSEEAFVRAWKALPDEPLTLSGAVRYVMSTGRGSLPSVTTGIPPAKLQVKAETRIDVEAGRIGVAVDATLTETDGPVFEAVVECPEGFRPIRVAADGLTEWSAFAARSLRLRFDGPPARVRKLAITGWLPVSADLKPAAGTTREVAVPWLRWPDQDELPGTLSFSGPTRVVLVGDDANLVPPDPKTPAPAGLAPSRETFHLARPLRPGRLRWEVQPPRVTVLVESQLTLDPGSAEWLAVLRYDVSGGPLEMIHLKIPSAWAREMDLRLSGMTHQRVTETYPDYTAVAIRPDRPVWGSQRLILRSSLPFAAGASQAFPEVTPLGLGGVVDIYLRIVNATRQTPAIEGSPGLQAVVQGSVPPDEELMGSTPRAATSSSYHVIRPGWTLRVTRSGGPESGSSRPRVVSAKVVCTLGVDGSVVGLGRYDLAPGSGPFLDIGLPPDARLLWASVNGTPAVPLRAASGRWQFALGDEGPDRAVLVWRTDGPASGPTGPRALSLPQLGQGSMNTVAIVHAPVGASVQSRMARLRRVNLDEALLEEAGWLKTQMAESLDGFDRAARKSGEDLVASLVRFGLRLRQSERTATWDPDEPLAEREARLSTTRLTSHRLRGELDEVLHNAALDEFDTAANVWLGLAPSGLEAPVAPTPELAASLRIRPLGRPCAFAGELTWDTNSPAMAWVVAPSPTSAARGWVWMTTIAAIAATVFATVLAWRFGSSLWLARLALGMFLAIAALAAGPLGLAAAAGLSVVGRVTSGRS